MRRNKLVHIFTLIAVLMVFYSCEKETEVITSEPVSDYLPLIVGKYITYRIDSTVFTNLGRNEETHRYQVKHEVDAQLTDNIGRPSYRIIRYLRDSTGTKPWTVSGTYFATPLNDQVEVIEDNLRFIKLHLPVVLDFYWKGNKYLTTNPYSSLFAFNNDDKMYNWDYRYDKFEPTTTIGTQPVNNVYSIPQVDESLNAPVTNFASYGSRNFALEKYAKSIGLVYRENILWEYQPNANGSGVGYKTGFGIKMWMIDHN